MVFDHIVITAPSNDICQAYKERCDLIQTSLPLLHNVSIHCISDPLGCRIGSGGGTLNVLAYLKDKIGSEELSSSKVLIIHSGGNSQRAFIHSICGKAWATLNGTINDNDNDNDNDEDVNSLLASPMVLLIIELIAFSVNISNGTCVVACSDVTLDISINGLSPSRFYDGVSVVTVSELPSTAKNHGVLVEGELVIDDQHSKTSTVKHYLQKPSIECMKDHGAINNNASLIDTGVVIFTGSAMIALIGLLDSNIIQHCTSKGINEVGQGVLRLELYSDILQVFSLVNGRLTKAQYYNSLGIKENNDSNISLYEKAIDILWEKLSSFPLYVINVKEGEFSHLGTIEEQLSLLVSVDNLDNSNEKLVKFARKYNFKAVVSSRLIDNNHNLKGVVCNSLLGQNVHDTIESEQISLIEHSFIISPVRVGSRCVVSNIKINCSKRMVDIKNGSMLQQIPLHGYPERFVFVLFYIDDDIKVNYQHSSASIFGCKWDAFFSITSSISSDVWDDKLTDQSLWSAKLFPICDKTDMIELIMWMQDIKELDKSNLDMNIINKWKGSKRVSMMELMMLGDASAMHLWQRYLSVIVKSKHVNTYDTLVDTYHHCKELIYRIKNRFDNMLLSVTIAMLLLCSKIITNDCVSEAYTIVLQHLLLQDASIDVQDIINHFNDFWIIISASSNSRLILEYLDSLLDSKHKIMVADALLHFCESFVAKEYLPRVVFAISWILRNSNLKFDSINLSQLSEVDVCALIRNKLSKESRPQDSLLGASIETLAQRIVYCQIQSSLDAKDLSFKMDLALHSKGVVLTTAPVRIDIAGGWSDTPPIAYEVGGSVLNCAVRVDDRRPIQCASRKIPDLCIILHSLKKSGALETVKCSLFKDFLNVSDTASSTSLLKAALLVLQIIDKNAIDYYRNINDETDSKNFSDYLYSSLGGGLEICCCSDLPVGSGMGGSSIVAAVVVDSIATLLGLNVDKHNLIYLVTQVEQILSSGGGYQDQQGSIYGGFKIGRSSCKLPLEINVQVIPVNQSFISTFEKRCYLIYTGKQRLAKNILINALRNCSLTPSSNDNTVSSLINGAEAGCRLLLSHYEKKTDDDDDCIDSLAAILDNYFKLKIQMAPGTDPDHIKDIISSLRHLTKGISLAGAGGGGFCVIILQKGYVKEDLVRTVEEYNTANQLNLTVHDVTIDTDGITSNTLDTLYANLKDYLLI